MIRSGNLRQGAPGDPEAEQVETLVRGRTARIERIVSLGQVSPDGFWYDQPEDEWVLLASGVASLRLEGEEVARRLGPGDWVFLPAGVRHRVDATSTQPPCVWVAVFFEP